METKQHKEDVSLRITMLFYFLTLFSCSRITLPHGGFDVTETLEVVGEFNVRIKIVDASTGQLIEGSRIVLKQSGKLEVIPTNQGIINLKFSPQKIWIRTSVVGFYHNEFIIEPNQYQFLEITSYQVIDKRPLHEVRTQ